MPPIPRRRFLADSSLALGALTLGMHRGGGDGRLSARPIQNPANPLPPGDHILWRVNGRDTVVVVPPNYAPERPAPLMLALHGAGQSSQFTLDIMRETADAAGIIMVAPSSVDRTWDAVLGLSFAGDCARIDGALTQVFQHFAIDPKRVAIAGFSDGATYSLSMGVVNGDLFTHIIAYSPGFMIPGPRQGKPPVFISHGRNDPILPFDGSRRLAADLKRDGYSVQFVAFDGGHAVTPEILSQATHWFTK